MGCVESRLESDLQTNIFHVVNVNERGQRQRSARLEVSETHLILHKRGQNPICWPLRCLRRYGFDAEQFSFESGRRSPSGPGIYNFKCRRAEALFNMLQYQIQNYADDTTSRDLTALPPNDNRGERDVSSAGAVALDNHGYLEPVTGGGHRRSRVGLNSISGASLSNSLVSGPVGPVNGGVGVLTNFPGTGDISGGLRTPGSPGPISPPVMPILSNNPSSDSTRNDENGFTPSIPVVENSVLPIVDPRGTIFMNFYPGSVTYINQSERPSSYSSSGSDRPPNTYGNQMDRPPSYVCQSDRPISFVKLDSPKQTLVEADEEEDENPEHLYMNVDTDSRSRDRDPVYANLGIENEGAVSAVIPLKPLSGLPGGASNQSLAPVEPSMATKITYVQVDLDRGSDSSQNVPISPLFQVAPVTDYPRALPLGNLGYATIDFDKTEALSSTAKAAALWKTGGDGARRSRNNSTFSGITSLGRHNSTLSD